MPGKFVGVDHSLIEHAHKEALKRERGMDKDRKEAMPVHHEDCPFCYDNTFGRPKAEKHILGRYFIQCQNPHCGAHGGFSDTEEEAWEIWDRRQNAT